MNNEEVLEFPTLPEEETLEVPKVAYEDLKKDELIKVLEHKDKSLEHYETLQEENKNTAIDRIKKSLFIGKILNHHY